jgi:hypothetical protein
LKEYKAKIQLAPDLEKALLRAIATGVVSLDSVQPDELSKNAALIFKSIKYLIDKHTKLPLRPTSILLAACLFGAEKKTATAYLKSMGPLEAGEEITSILRSARDKHNLVNIINEAGSQLSSGDLQVNKLTNLIGSNGHGSKEEAISEDVKGKFPKPPIGVTLRTLPRITEYTNGLFGIWIIGGEPGTGKSTFAWQLSIDYSAGVTPVIYYDLDGTGRSIIVERTREIVGGNVRLYRKLTKAIHYRETIHTLEEDLIRHSPPGLIVIDTMQTLPTSIKFSKQSLDEWIKRFKGIAQKGYTLLLISEKPRSQYGAANLSGYKGTGDLEYAGSLCVQLVECEDADDEVEFHIVKNRHGSKKGHVINLQRDPKKIFWFKETTPND